MDMEISDEESEDGQITKLEQEEEKERKLFSKTPATDDQPITMEDLEKCRLTRDLVSKSCMAPWFQEYVQGGHYELFHLAVYQTSILRIMGPLLDRT